MCQTPNISLVYIGFSKNIWCVKDLWLLWGSYISSWVLVCVKISAGKEDGKTCKRVAIRTTIRKDDCRSNAPVREKRDIHLWKWGVCESRILNTFSSCGCVLFSKYMFFIWQVTVYSCDGKCPSATIFNFNINSHARFCKCCRESGLQTRSVALYCSRNATVVEYNFQEPLDCSCQWN